MRKLHFLEDRLKEIGYLSLDNLIVAHVYEFEFHPDGAKIKIRPILDRFKLVAVYTLKYNNAYLTFSPIKVISGEKYTIIIGEML